MTSLYYCFGSPHPPNNQATLSHKFNASATISHKIQPEKIVCRVNMRSIIVYIKCIQWLPVPTKRRESRKSRPFALEISHRPPPQTQNRTEHNRITKIDLNTIPEYYREREKEKERQLRAPFATHPA